MNILDDFKKRFNEEINTYFAAKIKKTLQIDKNGAIPLIAIQEMVNYGGKRFRPALFYFAYTSYSSVKKSEIFKTSFVFELFHTCALIHDDIMDNSDLRRGQPTIHRKYNIGTAILTGDLALMLADELWFDSMEQIVSYRKEIHALYNEFKQELIVGQYLDLIHSPRLYTIMRLKTARYSFEKPIILGLSLAGVEKKTIRAWSKVATDIGILFQIKDDIKGTFATESQIGKPVDSDLKEGKNTLIIQDFLAKCSDKEKERFNSFFGKKQIFQDDLLWYRDALAKYQIFKSLTKKMNIQIKKVGNTLKLLFPQNYLTRLISTLLQNLERTTHTS